MDELQKKKSRYTLFQQPFHVITTPQVILSVRGCLVSHCLSHLSLARSHQTQSQRLFHTESREREKGSERAGSFHIFQDPLLLHCLDHISWSEGTLLFSAYHPRSEALLPCSSTHLVACLPFFLLFHRLHESNTTSHFLHDPLRNISAFWRSCKTIYRF